MAMINCKECGNSLSSSAEKCPHCGVQLIQRSNANDEPKKGASAGMRIAVLIFVIMGLISCIGVGACTGMIFSGVGGMNKHVGNVSEAKELNQESGRFMGMAFLEFIFGLWGGIGAFNKFNTGAQKNGYILLFTALLSIHNIFQFFTSGFCFGIAGLLTLIGSGPAKA